MLHQYILSEATPTELAADSGKRECMSRAALDTATRIMIDVAEILLQRIKGKSMETMPLCCTYTFRMAHEYIESGGSDKIGGIRTADAEPLLASVSLCNERWVGRRD